MADRKKFGDKFSRRTTRNERFLQMSTQAELIEQKKREIEAKLRAREMKANASDDSNASSASGSASLYRPSTGVLPVPVQASSSGTLPLAVQPPIPPVPVAAPKFSVPFRNDGSFLDQFRKIAQAPPPVCPGVSNHHCYSSSTTLGTLETPGYTECDIPLPPTDVNPLDIPLPNASISPPGVSAVNVKPEIVEKQEPTLDERAPSPYSPSRPCSDDEEDRECDTKSPVFPLVKVEPEPPAAPSSSARYSPSDLNESTNSKDAKNAGSFVDIKTEKIAESYASDCASNERARKRKSRWGPEEEKKHIPPIPVPRTATRPSTSVSPGFVVNPGFSGNILPNSVLSRSAMLSRITQSDPQILAYAVKVFGTTDLTEDQWKQCMDQVKMQYVYQEMLKKRQQQEQLEEQGKVKYEYDSDEDVEGGTWEHKRRLQEMEKTKEWADNLTRNASGRHHIGDFLPPEELAAFTKKYQALKEGQEYTQADYEEFKIAENNVGYQMLKKFGWSEGQGLGVEGTGITAPVNQNNTGGEKRGLGALRPDDLTKDDDEFEAYRKRMMLAYRFRPNPLNNPRRQYY